MKRKKFLENVTRPKIHWCESCGSKPVMETIKNEEKYCQECIKKLTMEGFNNIGRNFNMRFENVNDVEDEIPPGPIEFITPPPVGNSIQAVDRLRVIRPRRFM